MLLSQVCNVKSSSPHWQHRTIIPSPMVLWISGFILVFTIFIEILCLLKVIWVGHDNYTDEKNYNEKHFKFMIIETATFAKILYQ